MPTPNLPFGYVERKGSKTETYDGIEGNLTATRIFYGPWEHRIRFIKEFLPDARTVDGVLVISEPAPYPDYENLVATKATVKPLLGADNKGEDESISYTSCEIEVQYETVVWESSGQIVNPQNPTDPTARDFVIEELHSSVEVLAIPPTETKLSADNSIVWIDGVNVRIVYIHFVLTQLFVPEPRWQHINNALGKLNSVEVPFLFGSRPTRPAQSSIAQLQELEKRGAVAPIETLLYEGVSSMRKTTTFGTQAWEVKHSFVYNRHGWQNAYTKEKGFKRIKIPKVQGGAHVNSALVTYSNLYELYDHRLIFGEVSNK